MRVESEYRRGGTLAYFAAYDVHRAHVIGRCERTTGIEPFTRLTAQVMATEPYASARRVFWIVDNGASTAIGPRRNYSTTPTPTRTWCTYRCTPPG